MNRRALDEKPSNFDLRRVRRVEKDDLIYGKENCEKEKILTTEQSWKTHTPHPPHPSTSTPCPADYCPNCWHLRIVSTVGLLCASVHGAASKIDDPLERVNVAIKAASRAADRNGTTKHI